MVQFWDEGLEGCVEELGEERWMVLEQVLCPLAGSRTVCLGSGVSTLGLSATARLCYM